MKKYNPNIHHRKSIRLKGYDYSQAGLYFITICCQDRACLFGEIIGAKNFSPNNEMPKMMLNDAGKIANDCWLDIPNHFLNSVLHEHIIMPNHVHGIIELVGAKNISPDNSINNINCAKNISPDNNNANDDNVTDAVNRANDGNGANDGNVIRANDYSPLRSPSKTIGSIVRGFKIGVTKWMRQNTDVFDVWQRNYYEHIIRNEKSYNTISEYIINNPAKWTDDKFFTN